MRRVVPMVGDGTSDSPRQPLLPEGASFAITEWLEDGRVVVEYEDPREHDAVRTAARLATVDKVTAGLLTDDEVATLSPIFDSWYPGLTVEAGDVLQWDGTLVECLQPHTNYDPSHTPDVTPALWKVHRTNPGTDYPVWVQPGSTNPYNATWDDGTSPVVVRFPDADGALYVNTHGNGNVWSPASYGWALYTP